MDNQENPDEGKTRDELIAKYENYCHRIVHSVVSQRPTFKYMQEDLHAEALLQLVSTLDRVMDNDQPDVSNIQGLLSFEIEKAVLNAMAASKTVTVPRRTEQRIVSEGQEASLPSMESVNLSQVRVEDQQSATLTLDDLLDCCETIFEEQVIRLKSGNMYNRDIAEVTGVHPNLVTRAIRNVHDKYFRGDNA